MYNTTMQNEEYSHDQIKMTEIGEHDQKFPLTENK